MRGCRLRVSRCLSDVFLWCLFIQMPTTYVRFWCVSDVGGFTIYKLCLPGHCGSRPAGEVLFVYSHKEYPEKAATSAAPL